jgi:hypothetical protein
VSDNGDALLVRSYGGCFATRPRRLIAFRERIVGESPPSFAVRGSPHGLGYNMNVSIQGEWAQHLIEFHKPWTVQDGPFDLEFETTLPGAFVLDIEEYNRRRAAEGLPPRSEGFGDYCTLVSYAFEKLELHIVFPRSYEPSWEEPTAVWGGTPIDDADYCEVHERTCMSVRMEPGLSDARLKLEKPVPGYAFGIRWKPVAGRAVTQGEES